MKTPEGYEKDDIRKYLNSIGAYHVVTHMTGFGAGGTPDIIACIAGCMWGIEVKREGKEPTPRQLLRIEAIKQAGGQATWGTATKVIHEIEEWAINKGMHFPPINWAVTDAAAQRAATARVRKSR